MEEPRTRRAVMGVVLSIFLGAMESTVVATAMRLRRQASGGGTA